MTTDLLLDDFYDLAVDGGDFVTGASDDQHVALLLLLGQGELRADPLAGIGLRRYQSAPMGPAQRAELARDITIQLTRDGYRVDTVEVFSDGQLTLDATRP